jgi:hypothetical protein
MSSASAPAIETPNCRIEQNRLKGFLGTADEVTAVAEILAPHSVAWVKSLSDDELLPLGAKALNDIADDIIVLDECRQRFRLKGSIQGYQGWKDFVEKHSKFSMRTIQRRLNEVNGVRPYTLAVDKGVPPVAEQRAAGHSTSPSLHCPESGFHEQRQSGCTSESLWCGCLGS